MCHSMHVFPWASDFIASVFERVLCSAHAHLQPSLKFFPQLDYTPQQALLTAYLLPIPSPPSAPLLNPAVSVTAGIVSIKFKLTLKAHF